jgi:hypothetical protein
VPSYPHIKHEIDMKVPMGTIVCHDAFFAEGESYPRLLHYTPMRNKNENFGVLRLPKSFTFYVDLPALGAEGGITKPPKWRPHENAIEYMDGT